MTDVGPDAFPKAGDTTAERRRKAQELTRFPRHVVSGPALRLAGARVLFELGDIERDELQRYEREAREEY